MFRLGFFLLFCVMLSGVEASAQTVSKDWIDGEIYFKIKNDASLNIPNANGEVNFKNADFISPVLKKFHIVKLSSPFCRSKFETLKKIFLLEFSDIYMVEEIIRELQKINFIEYAEKAPLPHIDFIPNDPYLYNPSTYSQYGQYNLRRIHAEKAWDYCKGDSSIAVAVVDIGVSLTHPDLQANVWTNKNEIPNNGIDDDNDGYIDDIHGWDAADNDNDPDVPSGFGIHGNHCSGIVSAVTNNNSGISSIGYSLKIMAVKCATDASGGSLSTGYEGISYAIDAGAKIISNSWSYNSATGTGQTIMDYAYSKGVIVVACAGNSSSSSLAYPAAYNHVISTCGLERGDEKASLTTYGSWIDISAPCRQVLSTVQMEYGGYEELTGNSMAAPLVAGLCGLMLSLDPTMTPDDVENCLKSTAVNLDYMNPGFVGQVPPRINAAEAMNCVSQRLSRKPEAFFSADMTNSCSGKINFTGESIFSPASWLWDFGDGNFSSQQNPTHVYANNGIYNVKLTAMNANGSNALTKNNFITVNRSAAPSANGASGNPGDDLTLTANASNGGTLAWYSSSTSTTILDTGNIFITPQLFSTDTFYVDEEIPAAVKHVGPTIANSTNTMYVSDEKRHLFFDVYVPITLKSVEVDAQSAGVRTIELRNNDGALLNSAAVNIPQGNSRVQLNFFIPPGRDYRLKLNGTTDLLAHYTTVNYPYTLANVMSITTDDFGITPFTNDFYYYFYDWEIQETNCASLRTPVVAAISSATSASENNFENEIQIFPNPSDGKFTVAVGSGSQAAIEIYNSIGEKVFEKNISAKSEIINLNAMENGIYFISIITEKRSVYKKLILNR